MGAFPAHILSASDFSLQQIREIFASADAYKREDAAAVQKNDYWLPQEALHRLIMYSVFKAESLRTRTSFEHAMLLLGGRVITSVQMEQMSSKYGKGESLEDSMRVLLGFNPPVFVIREAQAQAAAKIAPFSKVTSIINAGDGSNEHPTQAIIDLYPMFRLYGELGRKISIAFVGDNADSRTVRSDILLFVNLKQEGMDFVKEVTCISPEGLEPPEDVVQAVHRGGIPFTQQRALTREIAAASDVIYMTRYQHERKGDRLDQRHIDGRSYTLTLDLVAAMPQHGIILHPLPRREELPVEVDGDPRARYFEQAADGRYLRMALLRHLLRR